MFASFYNAAASIPSYFSGSSTNEPVPVAGLTTSAEADRAGHVALLQSQLQRQADTAVRNTHQAALKVEVLAVDEHEITAQERQSIEKMGRDVEHFLKGLDSLDEEGEDRLLDFVGVLGIVGEMQKQAKEVKADQASQRLKSRKKESALEEDWQVRHAFDNSRAQAERDTSGNDSAVREEYRQEVLGLGNVMTRKDAARLSELFDKFMSDMGNGGDLKRNHEFIKFLREVADRRSGPTYIFAIAAKKWEDICDYFTAKDGRPSKAWQQIAAPLGKFLQLLGNKIVSRVTSIRNFIQGLISRAWNTIRTEVNHYRLNSLESEVSVQLTKADTAMRTSTAQRQAIADLNPQLSKSPDAAFAKRLHAQITGIRKEVQKYDKDAAKALVRAAKACKTAHGVLKDQIENMIEYAKNHPAFRAKDQAKAEQDAAIVVYNETVRHHALVAERVKQGKGKVSEEQAAAKEMDTAAMNMDKAKQAYEETLLAVERAMGPLSDLEKTQQQWSAAGDACIAESMQKATSYLQTVNKARSVGQLDAVDRDELRDLHGNIKDAGHGTKGYREDFQQRKNMLIQSRMSQKSKHGSGGGDAASSSHHDERQKKGKDGKGKFHY